MKIRYDSQVDALAIDFVKNPRSAKTQRMGPGINFDFDKKGNLVSIEILDASTRVSKETLAAAESAEDWILLSEASKDYGLDSDTYRSLIHKGRLRGKKEGRDWKVTRADVVNYLDSRDNRGRPTLSKKARRLPISRANEADESTVLIGSGNVFADLGFPDAKKRKAKADRAIKAKKRLAKA